MSNGFHEELTILNHADKPVSLTVRIDAGCDFADLFEVKDALRKKGRYSAKVERRKLTLGYERGPFARATAIAASERALFDAEGLTFTVKVPAHGEWSTEIDVVSAPRRGPGIPRAAGSEEGSGAHAAQPRALDRRRSACRVRLGRAQVDLPAETRRPRCPALLSADCRGRALPAAGLPWFMTMFGRDSIFTSLQALPFTPELAATTLRALGDWQGVRLDDFRDEDPGRILHEMRYGEMTAFEERPHSPYYGSVDATPLYIVLLDEYERWTGDRMLVRARGQARAALNWIDEYGDLQGTGYIWYRRRNEESGLENQCWKDSWDSISFRDGTLPGFPRATCELQGYAYDAKVRGARLAREIWKDAALADRLERDAADLKRRFNRDFWVEDGEYFAIALDQDGRQVDSLSSNNGHLLWSGIVDKAKAKAVARHLLGPRLFSGWGVRTWPPARVATARSGTTRAGLAVRHSSWRGTAQVRLQARGGRDRGDSRRGRVLRRPAARGVWRLPTPADEYPAQYPTACSPQAWSTGTRFCSCEPCSGWSRTASTSSSIPRCRHPSATSSCWTSPVAGAGWTRSAVAASRRASRAGR